MKWYAAHLLQFFKVREGIQTSFPVWENIVLIQAESWQEAFQKAQEIGAEHYGDIDDGGTLDDLPTKTIFVGVRKVVECYFDLPFEGEIVDPEVTYNNMWLESEEDVYKLLRGEPVTLELD